MSVLDIILPPIDREGYRFVGVFAAITLVLFYLFPPLGWIGAAATVWCYYFFRDRARVIPQRDGLVVSPADGVVSMISDVAPPAELALGNDRVMRISVFMNVFNCHVNRIPIAGTVEKVHYIPGAFLNASLDKASEDNERNCVTVRLGDGRQLGVIQIAGLVARRIRCDVREGQAVATGERFGLIRFGSRLDIYLPENTVPLVCIGQTMVAGETVLADLSASEPARSGRSW